MDTHQDSERVPDGKKPYLKEHEELYESGKHRRYSLLFAVNGGAYTLAIFLINLTPRMGLPELGYAVLLLLAAAMARFSWIMCDDIWEYGEKMRKWDEQWRRDTSLGLSPETGMFQEPGKEVLTSLKWLLVGAWLLVGLLTLLAVASHWSGLRFLAPES